MYYRGDIFSHFRSFIRVKMSEHGGRANEFNNISEHKGVNCYILSRSACLFKCIDYVFKKDFSKEYFEFTQSYKMLWLDVGD